jgi:hypothetical protein
MERFERCSASYLVGNAFGVSFFAPAPNASHRRRDGGDDATGAVRADRPRAALRLQIKATTSCFYLQIR